MIRRCRCLSRAGEKQKPEGCGLRCATSARGASAVPPAAFYRYAPDRKAQQARALLQDCRGYLHADAYGGFKPLYEPHPVTGEAQLTEVACWAHARRKIYEVHAATGSPAAQLLLSRIGELFAIEAAYTRQTPDERLAVRAAQTVPLLAQLKSEFEAALAQVSGKSTLAQALRYALSRWDALSRYTDRRTARHLQQRRRTGDQASGHRTQELAVRRFRHRRRTRGGHVHAH